jgi:hypothetical protein
MKHASRFPCRLLLLLFVGTGACNRTLAEASPVAQLLASGRLQVESSLDPAENIVPGQRVTLTLQIATDTWFTGGTRIGIPEIPGLVILQTEQFASNASETRDGQTWVIQRWTLDIFPQRVGDFTIDALPLQLQVNDGDGGDATGEVQSPAVRFSVAIPDSLATAEQWVAAPAFTVTQRFDRALDDLAVGDAFEQEVHFEASEVLAMMLPAYEAGRQHGLAAYPAPPVLDNSNNRGQSRATRTTRTSYVVEEPGKYRLGAREYLWWNTARGALEILSLPETRIEVKGDAPLADGAGSSLDKRHFLLALAGLAATVFLFWLVPRLSPRLHWRRAALPLRKLAGLWQTLRRPALPRRLNPGGSAGG